MSDVVTTFTTRWYAIYTHPKQESRAEHNLRAWNVETFHPKVRERRANAFTGAQLFFVTALFPRYIFARFDARRLLHKICLTRGVHDVVRCGSSPVPIDDEVVDFIKSNVNEDGIARIGEDFKAGDRVVIKDGPLKGLTAIFNQRMNYSTRVMLLLEAVTYQSRVIVERDLLVRC